MEGNITHTWLKTKRALHGENHLNAWLMGQTQPTDAHGWTCSLSLQLHPFFPFKHEVIIKGFTWSCCWNVKFTDVIRLKLQNMKISHYIFVFKFILLSIFYSLSLYHPTNVIIQLDSFSHVAEMLRPLLFYGWSYKLWR